MLLVVSWILVCAFSKAVFKWIPSYPGITVPVLVAYIFAACALVWRSFGSCSVLPLISKVEALLKVQHKESVKVQNRWAPGALPSVELGGDVLQNDLKLLWAERSVIKISRRDSCQDVRPGTGTMAVSFTCSQSDWYGFSASCSQGKVVSYETGNTIYLFSSSKVGARPSSVCRQLNFCSESSITSFLVVIC